MRPFSRGAAATAGATAEGHDMVEGGQDGGCAAERPLDPDEVAAIDRCPPRPFTGPMAWWDRCHAERPMNDRLPTGIERHGASPLPACLTRGRGLAADRRPCRLQSS